MDKLLSLNKNTRITLLLSGFLLFFILFLTTGKGIFILFYLGFIAVLIYTNIQYSKKYSSIMEMSLNKAISKHKFNSDYYYLSDDYLTGIALNSTDNKIAIFKRYNVNDNLSPTLLDFKDIIECSIVEDGETVTCTSKGSAIGHAVAGGVLFGGIGAVVGGLSGEKVASTKIYKATLSIVVDNLHDPIQEIHFLNSNMLVDRSSTLYQKVYSDLNKWHKTLSIIIKRNENELNSKTV